MTLKNEKKYPKTLGANPKNGNYRSNCNEVENFY